MKSNFYNAFLKMRFGLYTCRQAFQINKEYLKGGWGIFLRGFLDLFGLHKYPEIK